MKISSSALHILGTSPPTSGCLRADLSPALAWVCSFGPRGPHPLCQPVRELVFLPCNCSRRYLSVASSLTRRCWRLPGKGDGNGEPGGCADPVGSRWRMRRYRNAPSPSCRAEGGKQTARLECLRTSLWCGIFSVIPFFFHFSKSRKTSPALNEQHLFFFFLKDQSSKTHP